MVDSAGEGGYDECIKHLDPKKVGIGGYQSDSIVPICFDRSDWS